MSPDLASRTQGLARVLNASISFRTIDKIQDRVQELGDIGTRISVTDVSHDFCANIVRTCLDFADGLERLDQVFTIAEPPESLHIAAVRDAFDALDAARKAARQAVPATNAVTVAALQAMRASGATGQKKFALIVGVGRYAFSGAIGKPLGPKEFTPLEFAAKDAKDLHEFLSAESEWVLQPALLDDQASLRNIMRGLDELRRACAREVDSEPLALVYFSGHGASAEGRDYLVPHDGSRDDLFSTALWSRTLDNALNELATPNVLLILDACRAGAVGAAGAKDAGLLQVDPNSLVGDPGRTNRRVVASCSANQLSWESNGNGVFTRHLLGLLRQPEQLDNERIDLWDLTQELVRRVRDEALANHGAAQEPFANFRSATGIILAINAARRRERRQREQGLLDALRGALAPIDANRATRLEGVLNLAIKDGMQQLSEYARVVKYFRSVAFDWAPGDSVGVHAQVLLDYFGEALDEGRRPGGGLSASRATGVPPTTTIDKFTIAAPLSPTLTPTPSLSRPDAFTVHAGTAVTPPSAATFVPQMHPAAKRRRLTPDACAYICKPIWEKAYLDVATGLKKLLEDAGGVAEDDVVEWMLNTQPKRPEAQARWVADKDAIMDRFNACWNEAEDVKTQSAIGIRAGGNDG